jgi:hypothetical protein
MYRAVAVFAMEIAAGLWNARESFVAWSGNK